MEDESQYFGGPMFEKLLGPFKKPAPKIEGLLPSFEPTASETILSLPPNLGKEAIVAIHYSQAEMYDLGNIGFIDHFVLFDRKTRVAVDVTAQIKQAELLSQMPRGCVGVEQFVEFLEGVICGDITLTHVGEQGGGIPQGIRQFTVTQIAPEHFELVREAMSDMKLKSDAFNESIDKMERILPTVKGNFGNAAHAAE